ncbi:hypothetical protein MCOR27_000093 [Pyricularia oryzae]|nr:hypothetical protein MCOR27_000093 [Pyricularia oryzae]KAI6327802.1 hypothetical protein MCOR29_002828 [Pyricularia oryzae]KAI6354548.1 hypothetical protein MCOR32_010515 [Pyricularia oryzae]KAI6515550.1 hypothetical protein MCOR10_008144 [Pyricularia oryzae]KAI6559204.1 hypothetical protein MCOR09_008838 [Pyricularia oryzae]
MGTMPTDAVELHKKCGKMVRIGTDKVMVDGSIAWSRVHQRQPNQPQFGKYPAVAANHAFSEAVLPEQKPLAKYINQLMRRLGDFATQGKPFNLPSWFDYSSLDVIGDLVFANSFRALDGETNRYRLRIIDANISSIANTIGLEYPIMRLLPISLFVNCPRTPRTRGSSV